MNSGNQSLLGAYAQYACGDGKDYFLTDPARSVNAELASLEGGCVNMPLGHSLCLGSSLRATARVRAKAFQCGFRVFRSGAQ